MKLKWRDLIVVPLAIAAPTAVMAHPGHEPSDFLHAIAHELASPRGMVVLFLLSVAAALWFARKKQSKK